MAKGSGGGPRFSSKANRTFGYSRALARVRSGELGRVALEGGRDEINRWIASVDRSGGRWARNGISKQMLRTGLRMNAYLLSQVKD